MDITLEKAAIDTVLVYCAIKPKIGGGGFDNLFRQTLLALVGE